GELIIDAFSGLGDDSHVWGSYSTYYGGRVSVVKKLSDGKLLFGVEFSSFGGEPYSCLVRLEPSGYVGVDEKEGRGKLKIFPNSAGKYINISLPDKNQSLKQAEIYDLNGRLVKTVTAIDISGKIELVNLPQGIYVVKAISENQVYTGKLAVE